MLWKAPFRFLLSPRPYTGVWRSYEKFSEDSSLFVCFIGARMEVWPLQEHRTVQQSLICSCTSCSLSKTPCPGREWGLKFSACPAPQAVCMAIRLDRLNKGGSSFQFAQKHHLLSPGQTMMALICACSEHRFLVCTRWVGTSASESESRKLFFKDCKE